MDDPDVAVCMQQLAQGAVTKAAHRRRMLLHIQTETAGQHVRQIAHQSDLIQILRAAHREGIVELHVERKVHVGRRPVALVERRIESRAPAPIDKHAQGPDGVVPRVFVFLAQPLPFVTQFPVEPGCVGGVEDLRQAHVTEVVPVFHRMTGRAVRGKAQDRHALPHGYRPAPRPPPADRRRDH